MRIAGHATGDRNDDDGDYTNQDEREQSEADCEEKPSNRDSTEMYVLAALLLGSHGNTFVGGRPTHGWWAFVVHGANDIRGVLLAGALLSIGLTVFLCSGPRMEKHS
ncbi:hypothetical protein [Saccharopolyspora hattusasensis]|uniref:hypothetical protein n=1 Tax=Saccharopolyspora hattusasensis TaxID=1128679 RepID=UPI003D98585A